MSVLVSVLTRKCRNHIPNFIVVKILKILDLANVRATQIKLLIKREYIIFSSATFERRPTCTLRTLSREKE